MLDQLKLPASILLNSAVADLYPDIVARIKARGDDVLGHGRTNAEVQRGMWEIDEQRAIADVTEDDREALRQEAHRLDGARRA